MRRDHGNAADHEEGGHRSDKRSDDRKLVNGMDQQENAHERPGKKRKRLMQAGNRKVLQLEKRVDEEHRMTYEACCIDKECAAG